MRVGEQGRGLGNTLHHPTSYTLHPTPGTRYPVPCTLYPVRCPPPSTLHTLRSTPLYTTPHPTPYALRPTPPCSTLPPTPYNTLPPAPPCTTLHPTPPHILHFTPCTLHPSPYTLHPGPYTPVEGPQPISDELPSFLPPSSFPFPPLHAAASCLEVVEDSDTPSATQHPSSQPCRQELVEDSDAEEVDEERELVVAMNARGIVQLLPRWVQLLPCPCSYCQGGCIYCQDPGLHAAPSSYCHDCVRYRAATAKVSAATARTACSTEQLLP